MTTRTIDQGWKNMMTLASTFTSFGTGVTYMLPGYKLGIFVRKDAVAFLELVPEVEGKVGRIIETHPSFYYVLYT